tara:strand:- start:116 stop:271 length:156 start_codon:yes stop_codon:yes gene_type:complete
MTNLREKASLYEEGVCRERGRGVALYDERSQFHTETFPDGSISLEKEGDKN